MHLVNVVHKTNSVPLETKIVLWIVERVRSIATQKLEATGLNELEKI
jgi:hypothetical protein